MATIALSLVAVTGLSGQISLTQYLFLGIGAFVAGKTFGGDSVSRHARWRPGRRGARRRRRPPLGAAARAAPGAEHVRHRAHRARGDPRRPADLRPVGSTVGRPDILGVSTQSDAAFAVWCAVVFAVLGIMVGVVRRSWFGRQLTAIRDSELAAATLGHAGAHRPR